MDKTKTGLPFGCGSLQLRGNSLWAIYRDEHGKMIQRNLRTTDRDLGVRLLAELAIPAVMWKLRTLEGISYGEASARKLGSALRGHVDRRDPRRRPGAGSGASGNRIGAVSDQCCVAQAKGGR